MDFFDFKGKTFVLICDYFSKFPFMYASKTSWGSLKDRSIDLFASEGFPDEIVTDNGPPFNSHDFNSYLSRHGIRHTTSSPHYPQSNGFIERQIQTVKNMLFKSESETRSFQEVLGELRSTRIGDGLPSPAEMLHGRSLVTKETTTVDFKKVRATLMKRQAGQTKAHDKSHRAKAHRKLVMGERCVVLGKKNQWYDCHIAGIGQDGRNYTVQFEETGQRLQRTRCHIKPLGPDIPQLHPSFLSGERRGEVTTRNEAQNSVLSGPTKANSTAPVLVSGKKVTFNQRDQAHDIPARQAVQHTVIDPHDPDLTIRLRPSPEDTERDDDTVPDVPPAESSAASETDGTSDPDTSTTDGSSSEDATSSDTGASDSSSDSSSSESSSISGSEPSSPVRASTPSADTATGQQEQITPKTADTSMQARQFYGEMLGRPLTHKEFKHQKTQFGRQLAILQQVSRRTRNQLPTNEPSEPQPGTSKDSNDSDNSESSKAKPSPKKKNNNR